MADNHHRYLRETDLLDFSHPALVDLVRERKWKALSEYDKIGSIYVYVQNEIVFGFNAKDSMPASEVLRDGFGQCNTKATLFMALLRSVGIPCRLHGFTVDRVIQKGVVSGGLFYLAPKNVIHTWAEVLYQGRWLNLEGLIVDKKYLRALQARFPHVSGTFSGYGVATRNFRNPEIDWKGGDTYIQKEGVTRDYHSFDDPDAFYREHGENFTGIKALVYEHLVSKLVTKRAEKIRLG
ncbi:transglutaminase-like domain-containing protein [Dethiosulfatarculus sandiegensis]|uniref:Transglutaminase n=1 Tax=Dethiosulfatarculus sandiegensis TaxID=1429043 RepID=A0A0D2GDR8_9BACT|nr:transglutaminase family protein [Dethiosulfatarculus sandiegensis]KIX13092.1 transglutaminase [Dethiosulfatarculus sandiegensis]